MSADAFRVGTGYDSHRLEPGGPILLGGVTIPAEQHLVGHSDADVVCHAVTDALLGAAGLGDIGVMFPDTAEANRGRDSIEMLGVAARRVAKAGWAVGNVDVTLVCERPRISLYREAICTRIADAVGVAPERVSVKGKSNEGMGWIGRGEGVACIAVASLVKS